MNLWRWLKHRKPADVIPRTVSEAVDRLLSRISEEDKALIRSVRKRDMSRFHHGWGTGIRNAYGLWGKNQALLSTLPPLYRNADSASWVIMEAVWERLHGGDA